MDSWQKLLTVAAVALALIIVSRVIKRGRLDEEDPSVAEKGIFLGGIVLMAVALLILMFRCDTLFEADTGDEPQEIKAFQEEGAGCSKPKDQMGKFEP